MPSDTGRPTLVTRKWSSRVDAHVHLSRWWPDIKRTGYRADLDYTVAGLLAEMDRNRVDRALAIQMFQAPSTAEALAEGRQQYDGSGGRLLPVATADPTLPPAEFAAALAQIEAEPRLYGIKLFPGYRPFYPHDPRLDPLYELARRRKVPVLIHQGDTLDGIGLLKFARPVEVDEVAGRFRDVRFILCHLGNPWIEEAAGVVYKNPNVYTDTSGLFPHPRSRYYGRAIERATDILLGALVTAGSADRVLFGSDWPLEDLNAASEMIERLPIPTEDQAAILGGNAERLFGIGPGTGRV
jgi:uncharacterized protein